MLTVPLSVPQGLTVCALLSLVAMVMVAIVVPQISPLFIKSGLSGVDMAKRGRRVIPESMGLVAGLVYLVALFLLLPFVFLGYRWQGLVDQTNNLPLALRLLPADKFTSFLSALLSIQSMLFLGFADDVMDLKWRHKLLLPAFASLPLLIVYGIDSSVTWVVMPKPLHTLFGRIINLGPLYYIYMGMMAIFCTNSINILAGINGVEPGQSLIIAISIAVNSGYALVYSNNPHIVDTHLVSMYLIMPFMGVTLALLYWNWYPSRVFVGDTFTYFAGMVFAVIGILCHFSKTVMLFFLPQIFNFIYSAPQLFRLVPCPRHRLPSYNSTTDRLQPSVTTVPLSDISQLSMIILRLYHSVGILSLSYETGLKPTISNGIADNTSTPVPVQSDTLDHSATQQSEKLKKRNNAHTSTTVNSHGNLSVNGSVTPDRTKNTLVTFSNMTLLNLILVWKDRLYSSPTAKRGMHEMQLTKAILVVQVIGSVLAFGIRYGLVGLFYETPSF